MPPIVATVIFVIGIVGLFYLNREVNARTSKALWIPAAWLFIISSRPVSMWLGTTPPSDSLDIYLEGSPIDRAVFGLLVIAGLVVVISRMDRVRPLLRRNGPILLFFLFCALSIFWSDFPFVALKRWIKAVGDLVMILIILTEPDPVGTTKRLVTRLGFLLFPLSVLFVKYYPGLGRFMTGGWINTLTGVTTQKNSLGLICMLFGVCFLWMFRSAYRDRENPNRPRRLLAHGTILLMIGWLLYMCDSMTSITGLAMAGGVMLLVSRPLFIRKKALVHGLVLAVIGFALFATLLDPGSGLLQDLGRSPTLTGRTEIWSLVLSVPINPWVGTGFESFWLGSRLFKMRHSGFGIPLNEAHNGYIEVYLNLGWAGVTLLALLLLTGYRRIIAAFREDPEWGALFLGFFLTTLFESLTEAAFRMMTPSWIFLLLAIVAASQVRSAKDLLQIDPNPCGSLTKDKLLVNAVCSADYKGWGTRLATASVPCRQPTAGGARREWTRY